MARLILHPFHLDRDGAVATDEQGSDAQLESAIAQHVGTVIGEREMCWAFGVPDPGFNQLTAGDVQASVDAFGPDNVRITDVITTPVSDQVSTATVTWENTDDES